MNQVLVAENRVVIPKVKVINQAAVRQVIKEINQVMEKEKREEKEEKEEKKTRVMRIHHPQQRLRSWKFARKSYMKNMWMLVTS